ncbi:MAG: vWA domain-containing protein [Candidatus Choladocola sp.]|nr:vWA domain-containing protein [Candidatus Choladocola sp.]
MRGNNRVEKKFDLSLFFICLLGALVGFAVAETLWIFFMKNWNPLIGVGMYFMILAFFICISAWLCELISGHLRGGAWTGRETVFGILFVLLTTVVFFLLGMLFQFLYGLGFSGKSLKNIDDYIILIDNSGTTHDTDPAEERFSSVVELAGQLDSSNNIMVKLFEDRVTGTFPMTAVNGNTAGELAQFFSGYDSGGGTDIQTVLLEAFDEYVPNGRSAVILLLSDGDSNVNVSTVAARSAASGIPVYCIGFSQSGRSGSALLSQIADQTNGAYEEIANLSNLTQTVTSMVNMTSRRVLIEPRRANDVNNILSTILRIVFITVLGCLIGVGVALSVDSSELMGSCMIIHCIFSLLAGILTEVMMRFTFLPFYKLFTRLLMSLLIAVIAVSYYKESYHFGGDELDPFGFDLDGGSGQSRRQGGKPGDLSGRKKPTLPEEENSLLW